MTSGLRSIGMLVFACSALGALGGCSRTSDGTLVSDNSLHMPNMSIPSVDPVVPSWMRRSPQPEVVAQNFPPPPESEQARPRRNAKPPVVRSNSGALSCENKTEGGRVRMVCK